MKLKIIRNSMLSTKMLEDMKNKMVEERVAVKYISLHGCIKNTPSDTEVHAEHQLRVDRCT